jgi:hypothetical protein
MENNKWLFNNNFADPIIFVYCRYYKYKNSNMAVSDKLK